MEQGIINQFQGKIVKLVLDNGFTLIGIIDFVGTDSLIFSTQQKNSAISLDTIKMIVPIDDKRGG